jgi:hypothetical protein
MGGGSGTRCDALGFGWDIWGLRCDALGSQFDALVSGDVREE